MGRRNVCWAMYIVGFLLVLGSYVGLVPTGIAWAGWVIGMIGWVAWPRDGT